MIYTDSAHTIYGSSFEAGNIAYPDTTITTETNTTNTMVIARIYEMELLGMSSTAYTFLFSTNYSFTADTPVKLCDDINSGNWFSFDTTGLAGKYMFKVFCSTNTTDSIIENNLRELFYVDTPSSSAIEVMNTYAVNVTSGTEKYAYHKGDTIRIYGTIAMNVDTLGASIKTYVDDGAGGWTDIDSLSPTYDFTAHTSVTLTTIYGSAKKLPKWTVDYPLGKRKIRTLVQGGTPAIVSTFEYDIGVEAGVTTSTIPYDMDLKNNRAIVLYNSTLLTSLTATLNYSTADTSAYFGIYRYSDDSVVKTAYHSTDFSIETEKTHTQMGFTTNEMTFTNSGAMEGTYYAKFKLSGGTPAITEEYVTENFYLGSLTTTQPPVIYEERVTPSECLTWQDVNVTTMYQDDLNRAPTIATLFTTDHLGINRMYYFSTGATDYDYGIEYRTTIPAGVLPEGSTICTFYFANAGGIANAIERSIVTNTESILYTVVDEMSLIENLLKDKSKENYQLIKNAVGTGLVDSAHVLRRRPETYGKFACIHIQREGASEAKMSEYNQCEDLNYTNKEITFSIEITSGKKSHAIYNGQTLHDGVTVANYMADIVLQIIRENNTYTDPIDSNLKLLSCRCMNDHQIDAFESGLGEDFVGRNLTFKGLFRVRRA